MSGRPNGSTAARGPDQLGVLGDLAKSVSRILRRCRLPAAIVLGGETAYLFWSHQPGARAFGLIAAGAYAALYLWQKFALGLPVVPMLAVQHLITYGLPIASGNATLAEYTSTYLDQSGREVLIFCLSLAAGWLVGMHLFHPWSGISHALRGYQTGGNRKLARLGLWLALAASAHLLLQSLDLIDFVYQALPNGSTSLIAALVSAAGMTGFFLLAMQVGARAIGFGGRLAFWGLLIFNCALGASAFLLSAPAVLVASVMLGLFWGTGRVPWRYVLIVVVVLAFMSAGKYTMRARYWHFDADGEDPVPTFTLAQMPAIYGEWAGASLDAVTGDTAALTGRPAEAKAKADPSVLGRVNNLQNLAYVIRIIDLEHISLVHGATYALIPELLVPRILWPDKPRSHIGQEILNVHFGRQDLISTFSTYVAWGLLPEAYGNFGPIAGALTLGGVLGLIFAWVENFTARKLIVSLEGLLAFALMLAMANSFEMVSTVLVTSIVDSLLPIGLALLPFVHRTSLRPAGPAPP
jgi:hypothetical protein